MQYFKSFICAVWCMCFFFISVDAQNIDSLVRTIDDKDGLKSRDWELLVDVCRKNLETNSTLVQKAACKMLLFSQKENNKTRIATSYYYLGTALQCRNKPDSANLYMKRALALAPEGSMMQANIYHTSANIEADKGNYERSLSFYFQALKIFEQSKKELETAQVLSDIGTLYHSMGNSEKEYEYLSKSLTINRQIGSLAGIASNQANLGNYYFGKADTTHTIQALTEAQHLFHKLKNRVNEANVLGDIGDFYSVYYNQNDKAIKIYKDALALLNNSDNNNLRMDLYRKIALASYHQNHFDTAVQYMQKAIAITDTTNTDIVRMNYLLLTYDYIGLRDIDQATNSLDKYIELSDVVYRQNLKRNISETEVKYQTEKKELKIKALEKQRRLLGTIFISGVIVLIFLVLILYLRQRNIRTKKELAEQKVIQLEQEKKIIASNAVLEGETAERTRLARDLHDGLGGMLSAVKLNLFDIKQDVVIDADDLVRFNKVLGMLDNSIQELRRVAHNMMPESLSRYGLKIALEDFCNSFPNVNFHFFGQELRIDKTAETTVYRAVHELVNNAVRHSQANNINVQLILQSDSVSVNVQDDGKGFDPDAKTSGRGLQNIQNRIDAIGGVITIFSSSDNGTEIGIDIKLEPENGKN